MTFRLPERPADMAQEIYEGIVAAQTLRHELGIRPVDPVDCVLEVAERSLALDVVLAPLTPGVSGFYLPVTPTPVIVLEATHPVQRQRFTLAHEIGHHVLGHETSPRIHGEPVAAGTPETASGATSASMEGAAVTAPEEAVAEASAAAQALAGSEPSGGAAAGAALGAAGDRAAHYKPQRATSPDERAANAFAGEFLIPDAGAAVIAERAAGEDPLDQACRLSARFGISAFSAVVKLEMLGRFDRSLSRATRARLADGEHLPRYEELGLDPISDSLQRHRDAGGGERCAPGARHALRRLREEVDAAA